MAIESRAPPRRAESPREPALPLLLGIDTGGTYTDAVLFCREQGVVRSAKSLTTREDLSLGIIAAAARVLPVEPRRIAMVSISTTLATNAIVEGRGSPVCLLMVGQGPEALARAGLGAALCDDPVVFIAGGHDASGAELAPLDEDAVHAAVARHAAGVAAFAVAAHFAVRNAAHESRVCALVRERCARPVTCSQELSDRLDAPRRALTTVLNARLIPMITELVAAVGRMMADQGLSAPLMVVKGDGSLIRAELASQRPVETILSGPAASMVGAHHLSKAEDALVVDMGGTTSDVAVLERSRPRLRDDGASVGGWRTMVRAVSAHTVGLGGDSEVRIGKGGECAIGPRRVVPMSLLAQRQPAVLERLSERRERMLHDADQIRLATLVRPLEAMPEGLTRFERELVETLARDLHWVSEVAGDLVLGRTLERLVRRDLVAVCGFTPTDAAHVLGMQSTWSVEGARRAAELWRSLAEAAGGCVGPDPESFCRWVIDAVTLAAGRAAVDAALAHEGSGLDAGAGAAGMLVERALGVRRIEAGRTTPGAAPAGPHPDSLPAGSGKGDGLVEVSLRLLRPLVAVGAPAASYFPPVAERLSAGLRVPEHAEVANAVGAVAAGVMQRERVLISSPSAGRFRVHAGAEVEDFSQYEASRTRARDLALALAHEKARSAGADHVHVEVEQHDLRAPGLGGEEVFVETTITATAFGRPDLARIGAPD